MTQFSGSHSIFTGNNMSGISNGDGGLVWEATVKIICISIEWNGKGEKNHL